MTRLADYATKYQDHPDGAPRRHPPDDLPHPRRATPGGGRSPHGEFPQAFRDVGADPENKVVILTGTGDVFSGSRRPGAQHAGPVGSRLLKLGWSASCSGVPRCCRAWALAEQIGRQHALLLRYTRVLFTRPRLPAI